MPDHVVPILSACSGQASIRCSKTPRRPQRRTSWFCNVEIVSWGRVIVETRKLLQTGTKKNLSPRTIVGREKIFPSRSNARRRKFVPEPCGRLVADFYGRHRQNGTNHRTENSTARYLNTSIHREDRGELRQNAMEVYYLYALTHFICDEVTMRHQRLNALSMGVYLIKP